MYLDLNEEQKLIQDTARDFAKAELEPVAAQLDLDKDRPTLLANLKKLAELGFMGLNIKEAYGGSEAGVIAFSVAMTEIARACASACVARFCSASMAKRAARSICARHSAFAAPALRHCQALTPTATASTAHDNSRTSTRPAIHWPAAPQAAT